MLYTLQEGAELIGDEDLGKTRGQTVAAREPEQQEQTPEKPRLPRESTMQVTAQVDPHFLI